MLSKKLTALLASVVTLADIASGFQNTAPFIVISNTKGPSNSKGIDFSGLENPRSWSTDAVVDGVERVIGQCPYDAYIVVKQNNAHDSDLSASNMPHLAELANNAKYTKKFDSLYSEEIPITEKFILNTLFEVCNTDLVKVDPESGSFETYIDTTPRVFDLHIPLLSNDPSIRHKTLRDTDNLIYSVISKLPSPNFVVIYSGGIDSQIIPSENDDSSIHIEVSEVDATKSNTTSSTFSTAAAAASTTYSSLFQNYQFFSPGIWMGSIVSVFFLTVLYIALSWVSSLQVSYKAFEAPPTNSEKR